MHRFVLFIEHNKTGTLNNDQKYFLILVSRFNPIDIRYKLRWKLVSRYILTIKHANFHCPNMSFDV